MKNAVTVAWGATRFPPIVYNGDLERGLSRAASLGFDGVEVNGLVEAIDGPRLRRLLSRHRLELSALATGASAVAAGVGLCSGDPWARSRAVGMLRRTVDLAGEAGGTGTTVVIGLIVGVLGEDPIQAADGRRRALEEVAAIADHAAACGVRLAWEPINRYESTFANTVGDLLRMVEQVAHPNLGLLLDTFHMNIEEPSIEDSIRRAGPKVFYVQLADSNRWAPGFGHLDLPAVAAALRDVGYNGWVSAEVLPCPDPDAAAARALAQFKSLFPVRVTC